MDIWQITNFWAKIAAPCCKNIRYHANHDFWKDEQRRFVGVNQAFLDYYGFPGQEILLGKTDEEMGWHSDSEAFENDEWQVLRQVKVFHGARQVMARGEEREILASKSPL